MKTHALSLCCAYPMNSFGSDADASLFLKVCAQHTPVLPAESYTALPTPAERLRAISLLQHKAKVLETEKGRTQGSGEVAYIFVRRSFRISSRTPSKVSISLGPRGKSCGPTRPSSNCSDMSADEYIGHQLAEFYVDRKRFDEFWDRLMRHEIIYDFRRRCDARTDRSSTFSPTQAGCGKTASFCTRDASFAT